MSVAASSLAGDALVGAALAVVALAALAVYRVVRGPTLSDRVVATYGIGTATVVVLALLAVGLDEPGLLDVALVYALLNFVMSIAVSKFTVEWGEVL